MKLALSTAALLCILPASQAQTPAGWQTIRTKIGASFSAPADTRLKFEINDSPEQKKAGAHAEGGPVTCEGYLSDTSKCSIVLYKEPISKDESADDSVATKLENVIYDQVDVEKNKLSAINYSVKGGWPTVDVDVDPKAGETITTGGVTLDVTRDTGPVHYCVLRTKTTNYEVVIYGDLSKEDQQKVLDSLTLPQDAGQGDLTQWGPEAKEQDLADGRVSVWSPIEFKEVKDPEDDSGDTKSYVAEFGYIQLTCEVTTMPSGSGKDLDSAALDEMLKGMAGADPEDDAGSKVKVGEIQSYTSNLDQFRYLTYANETEEGRVDVVVKGDTMITLSISVPRGMLDSPEIRKFIASYKIN